LRVRKIGVCAAAPCGSRGRRLRLERQGDQTEKKCETHRCILYRLPKLFEQPDPRLDIADPVGGVLSFALDGDRTFVADLPQLPHESIDPDHASAERPLDTQGCRLVRRWPVAIFRMDRQYSLAKNG